MASFFVLMAIVLGASAGFLFLRRSSSRRGPTIPLVRIGIASGENEAQLWQQALARAGIWSRIIGGNLGAYRALGYEHELWVKEKDAELARDLLGIEEKQ